MENQEIRRENLRRWTADNGTPAAEKSYFSQLLSGTASFGERAARRLEKEYKMGDGYLDKPLQQENVVRLVQQRNEASPKVDFSASDEFIELLALYQAASEQGRKFILKSARAADKFTGTRWARVSNES